MATNAENQGAPRVSRLRIAAWSAAAFILLLPLVAMQFTDEVSWDRMDFVVFGGLLIAVGVGFELAARRGGGTASRSAYKTGVGLALLAGFVLFWVNGAVGIIGSEDNDVNMMYYGMIAVGIIGALVARFEPQGMARAMIATAAAQVLAFVVALVAGWGFTAPMTVVFGGLWLGSATMLKKRRGSDPIPHGIRVWDLNEESPECMTH